MGKGRHSKVDQLGVHVHILADRVMLYSIHKVHFNPILPRFLIERAIYAIHHRSTFECVVKRLRMMLYKPDYDSNDCELPNEKATPSILGIEV